MLAKYQYGESPEYKGISESLFQLYRTRTAQCLLSGDIAKCLPYTVETLRLNATAELNRRDDNRRGLWMMAGVIVRAAINMGYHRDPSHTAGVSVLQAEYRRRVWVSVVGMNEMASFVGGFPCMMSAVYSDTMEPRNIYEWELSDDTHTLPPSRPLEEATPATYLIVKGRLFNALGRVADFNNIPGPSSYEAVLEIDKLVVEAYENFPSHMKVYDIEESGGTIRTMAKFTNLGLFSSYHRGLCILHRRFMAKASVDKRFNLSRERCISSSLAILTFQKSVEPSFYKISQARQLLSLAAMILLLELELRRKSPSEKMFSTSEALLQALTESCALWSAAKDTCDEASRVYDALASRLSQFRASSPAEAGPYEAAYTEVIDDLAEIAPPSSVAKDIFSLDDDVSAMDLDWVSCFSFLAGSC